MDENTPELAKFEMQCDVIQKSAALFDEEGREYRFVLGPVMVPNRVDLQKQWAPPHEVANMCHGFMANYQNVGVKHARLVKSSEAKIVECYLMPCDGEVNGVRIAKDTWMMGTRCYGGLISKVDSGEFCGYSIEGSAELVAELPPG